MSEVTIRRLEQGRTWPRNADVIVQTYCSLLSIATMGLWLRAVGLGIEDAESFSGVLPSTRLSSVVTGSVDDPRWVAVSPGLASLVGYKPRDLVGESPLEIVDDDHQQRPVRRLIARDGHIDGAVTVLRTREYGLVPVVYSVATANDGELWISTLELVTPSDITTEETE